MALYSYQALSQDGKRVTGQLDATSVQAARDQLTKMRLYPIKIGPMAEEGKKWSFGLLFSKKIDVRDKIFFTKQLALLLKSGIPLLQALELLAEQSEGTLRGVVITLKDDIKEGKSLAQALERYPKIFDGTYVQLVHAGESSGKLEVILERLTVYLERGLEISRRISKAINYPLFQLGFIVVIVGLLLTFVVPQIAETLVSEGAELPWPTRFLLALSSLVTHYYLVLILFAAVVYFGFRWWRSTPRGAYMVDSLKLRLPLIRYFSRMGTVVQFSRTLGMLVESGVNLAESLFIVSKIVDNRILAETLNEARDNIIRQGRIAEYLKKTNIFPSVAIYLINTGEQSGHLGGMLLTVAEYYEAELGDLAESLSNKLGPIMTIIMALIVGFIIMAIVLPLIQSGMIAENI